MVIAFFLICLVVGVVCGAAIGYETRDLMNQPTGWRPWLLFAGVAAVVATGAVLVERTNAVESPSSTTKTVSLLVGAAAFAAALYIFRRRR